MEMKLVLHKITNTKTAIKSQFSGYCYSKPFKCKHAQSSLHATGMKVKKIPEIIRMQYKITDTTWAKCVEINEN